MESSGALIQIHVGPYTLSRRSLYSFTSILTHFHVGAYTLSRRGRSTYTDSRRENYTLSRRHLRILWWLNPRNAWIYTLSRRGNFMVHHFVNAL